MRKNTHNLFQQYNVPLICDNQEISPSSEVNFLFPLFMIETRVDTLSSPSSSTVTKLLNSTTAKRRGKLAWVKIIHRDLTGFILDKTVLFSQRLSCKALAQTIQV